MTTTEQPQVIHHPAKPLRGEELRGHGTMRMFHDEGCRCPWCLSTARERCCPCRPCVSARQTGRYVQVGGA